jgi:type II secretory pathway predicted ATPase ExeA
VYFEHFGLKEAPFRITPNTEYWHPGGQRGEILAALLYAIDQGEGIIKVVGEVGSGKTMLCRKLAAQLPGHIDSVYLGNPALSPDDMLAAILAELGASSRDTGRQARLAELDAALLARIEQGKGIAGAMFQDTTLLAEAKRTLGNVNALIADVRKDPKRYLKFSVF